MGSSPCIDWLTGEDHLQGATVTDQSGKALRTAAARQQAMLCFGQTQQRVVCRHTVMTGQGQLQGAPQTDPANSSDDWNGKPAQAPEQINVVLAPVTDLFIGDEALEELVNIGARREMSPPTRNDHPERRRLRHQVSQKGGQFLEEVETELIARRPAE
jgi:hypothetical protein